MKDLFDFDSLNPEKTTTVNFSSKNWEISNFLSRELIKSLNNEEKSVSANIKIEEYIEEIYITLKNLNKIRLEIKENIMLMETRKNSQSLSNKELRNIENNISLLKSNKETIEISITQLIKDEEKIKTYIDQPANQEIENNLNKLNNTIERYKTWTQAYLHKRS